MVLGEIQHADLTSGTFPDKPKLVSQDSVGSDRYIPARSSVSNNAKLKLKENLAPKDEYEGLLLSNMLPSENDRVLTYSERPPVPEAHDTLKVLYTVGKETTTKAKISRVIPKESIKTLDAPDLLDDFYCHLLDWSSQNFVAVALGNVVHLWNGETGKTEQLCEVDETVDITALRWTACGSHLAVGGSDSIVNLYDASTAKKLRKLTGHSMRVGCLAWNEHILTSGSKDGKIHHHDVRAREHIVGELTAHEQEVCGLEWSPDGSQLASGSNDNSVLIWNGMDTKPKHTLAEHVSAVKALAWCPFQRNLLASGGGMADRTIRFWNTQSGTCINSVDTGSQVSDLKWSMTDKELVSGHGFSQNQLSVWKYPSLVKVADLTGHTARVLSLAQSPDGTTVLSGSADETLRFWKIFSASDKKAASKPGVVGGRQQIR
jgi:cell division cycle protein 20 (cofactor of APC complex)